MNRTEEQALADLREEALRDELSGWRELCFLEMGVAADHAHALAQRPSWEFDLHDFDDLVRAGCTPELAERILRPLDDRSP